MALPHRGTIYRRLQEFDAAVEDFLKALDMVTNTQDDMVKQAQRQLLLAYNDFAVHCYTQGAYQEAVLLLNKALREEQGEKGLYINRGGEPESGRRKGRRAGREMLSCTNWLQSQVLRSGGWGKVPSHGKLRPPVGISDSSRPCPWGGDQSRLGWCSRSLRFGDPVSPPVLGS